MKEIKPIKLNYIIINFQYENELITIKSEPFKTLENAKMKAIKKMINTPNNDIHCFYLGIDITKNINHKVGDLFNHSEKVNIKLKSKEKNNKKFNLSLFIDKNNNKTSFLNKKKFNLDNKFKLKSLINKEKDKKESKSSDAIKPSKTNAYDNFKKNILSYISKNYQKNQELKLLSKNNIQGPMTNDRNKILPPLNKSILFDDSKTIDDNKNFLCKCEKNKISNYCKKCKLLLCNNCKIQEKHKHHPMIYLNEYNYVQSIFNYGNDAKNEIINNINIYKNILEKKNCISSKDLIKEKEKIIEKYKQMIEKYTSIVKKIENYLYKKENEERFKLEIGNFNNLLIKISKEIKDYMNSVKNKKLSFNNLEMVLNNINSKEEMIYYFNKNILKYYIINEINIKIKSTIKVIEKIIDDLIDDDKCFNLSEKYYEELVNMKIIVPPKKEVRNERKSIIIGGNEIKQNILNKRRSSIFRLSNKYE